VCCRPCRR